MGSFTHLRRRRPRQAGRKPERRRFCVERTHIGHRRSRCRVTGTVSGGHRLHRRMGGRPQDRLDRRPRGAWRDHARIRDQRRERPPALQLDRSVRARRGADDLADPRDGTAGGPAEVLPSAGGLEGGAGARPPPATREPWREWRWSRRRRRPGRRWRPDRRTRYSCISAATVSTTSPGARSSCRHVVRTGRHRAALAR